MFRLKPLPNLALISQPGLGLTRLNHQVVFIILNLSSGEENEHHAQNFVEQRGDEKYGEHRFLQRDLLHDW